MAKSLLRELRLFGWGYGLPFALMVLAGAVQGFGGSVPLWKLLLTLQNGYCVYGACYILPCLSYALFRVIVMVYCKFRDAGKRRY